MTTGNTQNIALEPLQPLGTSVEECSASVIIFQNLFSYSHICFIENRPRELLDTVMQESNLSAMQCNAHVKACFYVHI